MSLATVQQALLTVLQARPGLAGVPFTDSGPTSAEDLQNASGSYEAIWIGQAESTSVEPPFLGTPVTLDERYDIDLIVQVLKINEDADSQLAANVRADELLHEIIGCLCADPTAGITDTATLTIFEVLPVSWQHIGGWLGAGDQNASRYVLKVAVWVRLTLT